MKTKQKINCKQLLGGSWVGGVLIAALTAASVVAFIFSSGRRAATSEPTIPRSTSLTSWSENGHGGQYLLQVLEGNAPPAGAKVSGVVAGNTTCQPDDQGFSHCPYVVKLVNGTRITVIITHQMSRYRCLRSGDAVSLTRVNASWLVAMLR